MVFEGLSSQAIRAQARRLASYLPVVLTRRILQEEMPNPGTAVWGKAATLFSDLSGFTLTAETLAEAGSQGAEELHRTLLMTFTGLINAIHDAGGSVIHFHGDAMLVYFPDDDGQAAQRALACAAFMQRLLTSSFETVPDYLPPAGPREKFNIKIGVSYGSCCEIVVGVLGESLEFVLGGTAVDRAVDAQRQAAAGQVVAGRRLLETVGLPAADDFRVVNEVAPVPFARNSLHWYAYDLAALKRLLVVGEAFIPAAIVDRLQQETTRFLAEHRSVTTLFLKFEGIDFSEEGVGQKLQAYYEWARQIVARYGPRNGRVNRILTGDKGNNLHVLFGAPVAPDAPEQAIRCALALQAEKPDFISNQQIGLSVGAVFATAVGSQSRREYTVVGSVVNRSAHLTQNCPPGMVLVDEETAQRVRQQFDFEALPPLRLKGHAQETVVYKVNGEQQAPHQFAVRFARWQKTPIGRDEELAQLSQRIKRGLRGKGGADCNLRAVWWRHTAVSGRGCPLLAGCRWSMFVRLVPAASGRNALFSLAGGVAHIF